MQGIADDIVDDERHATDVERFQKVLGCVGGKRLTYAQVRG